MSSCFQDDLKSLDDFASPPNVKLSEVTAIHQKRLLAFINHFIFKTVNMLNVFSQTCELKLKDFETKVQKIEASLIILETKLSSIPSLADDEPVKPEPKESHAEIIPENVPVTVNEDEIDKPTVPEQESQIVKDVKLKDTPEYKRFFKMIEVGVPVQAVKLKMQLEGLDPNILDKN